MLQPYFDRKKVRTDHDTYDLAWGPPCRVWKADRKLWYGRPDPIPEAINGDALRAILPRLSEVLCV